MNVRSTYLSLAGQHRVVNIEKGLLNGRAAADGAVVGQEHHFVDGAEVSGDFVTFLGFERGSQILVLAHLANHHRLLTQGQQAALQARHGQHRRRVHMDDALDVGPRRVNRRVQHEARRVHAEIGCSCRQNNKLFQKNYCERKI